MLLSRGNSPVSYKPQKYEAFGLGYIPVIPIVNDGKVRRPVPGFVDSGYEDTWVLQRVGTVIVTPASYERQILETSKEIIEEL